MKNVKHCFINQKWLLSARHFSWTKFLKNHMRPSRWFQNCMNKNAYLPENRVASRTLDRSDIKIKSTRKINEVFKYTIEYKRPICHFSRMNVNITKFIMAIPTLLLQPLLMPTHVAAWRLLIASDDDGLNLLFFYQNWASTSIPVACLSMQHLQIISLI